MYLSKKWVVNNLHDENRKILDEMSSTEDTEWIIKNNISEKLR